MISRIVKITVLFIIFIAVVGISAYLTLTFIIRSEDTVVVPELNGKDVVYVLKILTDLGLNAKVGGSEYSDAVPMNHVIYQEPKPGAEIKKGRDIRIVVSKGTRKVLMPNLIGLSVRQARIILEENGLCPGKQSMTYNHRKNKDEIIAQVPAPGAKIKRIECVDMLTSMGTRPETYKMPDLIGEPVEEAILLIESNNLLLGDIKPVFHGDKLINMVVHQEPPAGRRVTEGHIVNLEANRRPGKIADKYLGDTRGLGLFRYRHANGFLKKRVRVKVNWFGVNNDIFDNFLRPGEEIWVLIPKDQDVSVFLYKDNELAKTQIFSVWQGRAD